MKLPSGRCLMYPDIKVTQATTPWGAKRKAISYRKQINGQWLRESTYGGKLTENAIQAIARDLMYYGAKQAEESGYEVLFSVYDEIIAEKRSDLADIKEFESLICKIPDWGKGIPLEAEGKLLNNYQKL
jgi:DNA polymerase